MYSLRGYQAEGKRQILGAWKAGEDIVMYMLATGGGKTVMFTEIGREELITGGRVMFIAHREELIMQTWQHLYNQQIYAGIIKGDHKANFDLPAQVCSIQTLARRKVLPPATLLVIDEGHHAQPDNTYGKIIKNYSASRVLSVTGSPYRLSGEGFTNLHPYKKTRLIIGRTSHELQNEGWLVPYRYYIASIPNLSSVRLDHGDYNSEDAEAAMRLAPLVESYLQHVPGKLGVVFGVNIAHSKRIAAQYDRAGIPSAHLDMSTPDEDGVDADGNKVLGRRRILSDFRCGLIKVVCNVGIITEGYDFPGMEFIQMAAPTKSLSKWLQMCGRVSRPEDGLVDQFATAAERKAAIARSSKPCGIILDNAGLWQDHGLPDQEQDWQGHFVGAKRAKKPVDTEIEILVFVAEDATGRRIRTTNPQEVQGMKLIEVTKNLRQRVVNLTSLKEFDKLYAMFKAMSNVKKPGYMALERYMQHCKARNILLVPEVWDYLEKQLITRPREEEDAERLVRSRNFAVYPDTLYIKKIQSIARCSVSAAFFQSTRRSYERQHSYDLIMSGQNRGLKEALKLNL